MSPSDPDHVLMRRFQDGDDTAFEVLVHKYQGLVLNLCRRYLGSRFPGVEDVAQEVFLRIFRGRGGWEPRAQVKTWIYRITVNACLNEIRHLRSQKHRRVATFTAVFGEDGPAAVPDRGATLPGSDRDAREVAVRVREAVDALPEHQRLAVILSRYHGCGYQEIARTMDTTVPAVKSLLNRARETLRRRLVDLVEGAGRDAPSRNVAERDVQERDVQEREIQER